MNRNDLVRHLLGPLVLALLASGWLLWTRAEPSRQGGYCMNATVEIAGVLQRADETGDIGRGPLPPADRLLAQVEAVNAQRFTVNTPADVQAEVDLLVAEQRPDAFAALAQDYLTRCRKA